MYLKITPGPQIIHSVLDQVKESQVLCPRLWTPGVRRRNLGGMCGKEKLRV